MRFLKWGSSVILIVAVVSAVACGDWPPVVKSRLDVERLPVTQEEVRLRALGNADLMALARLRNLRWLDFTSGWRLPAPAPISDGGLETLANLDLPKLTRLSLGFCPKITDAGMVSVARMASLREISLMGSEGITDAGLQPLVRLPRLKVLDLRGCVGVTDRGLETLATKRDWELIMLGGCSRITQAGLEKLRQRLPGVEVEKDDAGWRWELGKS